MNSLLNPIELTDARLVELHLDGDAAAFRHIVERHQGMVCALAYSTAGDVARSEDIAQEVFLVAWRQLPELREPAKLRSWLAGITRNLAYNSLRRAHRTPTARASVVPDDLAIETPDPSDRAISAEASDLMWAALAGLPEIYREPMLLFYREHRSITAVAETLEISEDTARQRLARGRTMLSERMAKFVEETIERSAPSPAFTGMVMLGLPAALAPAVFVETTAAATAPKIAVTAGTLGSAAAKGGVAVKLLGAIAALPIVINGVTEYLRFRARYDSPDESRRDVIRSTLLPQLANATLVGAFAFSLWGPARWNDWKWLSWFPPAVIILSVAWFDYRQRRAQGRGCVKVVPASFEYRSSGTLFGLPWLHIRVGGPGRKRRALGWIALSDGVAIGGLIASGPLAIAPISIGGLALGGLALGVATVGWGALGVFAAGGYATGAIAVATHAARGWMAIASDYALGAHASAAHVNDAVATEFFQGLFFFRFAETATRVVMWTAFLGWVPPLLLVGWHLLRNRRTGES